MVLTLASPLARRHLIPEVVMAGIKTGSSCTSSIISSCLSYIGRNLRNVMAVICSVVYDLGLMSISPDCLIPEV